jgi:hypothetical protein
VERLATRRPPLKDDDSGKDVGNGPEGFYGWLQVERIANGERYDDVPPESWMVVRRWSLFP